MTSFKWDPIYYQIEKSNCGSLRNQLRELVETDLYDWLCGDDGAWGAILERGVWIPMEDAFGYF